MTALQCLRQRGRMEAAHVAYVTGMSLGDVYLELVRAEAAGAVRVRCSKVRGGQWVKEWEVTESEKAPLRAALLCLGDGAAAVHIEVKAVAKTIHRGSVRA